ncbi:MAG: TIGR04086 family membrane protein [Clostridia bacterium]|nr:TIGR04086 family membrane protein [Clostridia bacterium]
MRENGKENKIFSAVLKGGATAVIITLVGILAFAFVIKLSYLNSTVIKSVNQFIKVLSVFLGCFIFVRENKGLLKGGLIGCFSAVMTYLIFALMGGGFSFGASFFIDLIFQLIVGAISGIITVNLKK